MRVSNDVALGVTVSLNDEDEIKEEFAILETEAMAEARAGEKMQQPVESSPG